MESVKGEIKKFSISLEIPGSMTSQWLVLEVVVNKPLKITLKKESCKWSACEDHENISMR